MNITKAEFIQQLVDKHRYTKKSAASLVEDFCNTVLENLEAGNTVSIRGFGCFDMVERAERSCCRPKTDEQFVVPAHWVPRFYPGETMKRAVKKWADNVKRGLI